MATSSSSTSTISQLSCFSSLNSRLHHLHRRSILSLPQSPRYKSWVVMSIEGHNNEAQTSTSNIKTSSTNHNYTAPEEYKGISDQVKGVYGSAKIHDFCFGIPFGGVVLSGGLLGFVFSRNAVTLGTGVLFGGALLALSTFSLKIWRQGKSSLPFVLGQAVFAAALCWNNFRAYSLVDKEGNSNRIFCCHQCCNAVLLFICNDIWRKPTTKEVAGICWCQFIIRN
ncbi:hypothetical protein Peur_040193 [Populus x canadensis]